MLLALPHFLKVAIPKGPLMLRRIITQVNANMGIVASFDCAMNEMSEEREN
jgi:hypothetical protein